MKLMILAYDLSYRAAILALLKRTKTNLIIVINPNSGPYSPDVKEWLALIHDIEQANAKRSRPVIIQWFGYVDMMPQKKGSTPKTTALVKAEIQEYQRRYRIAIKDSKRVVVINNVFADDCFADGPHEGTMKALVKQCAVTATTPSPDFTRLPGGFIPGVLMLNPGDALPPNHWQWTAAAFVVCYEGNHESKRGKLGPVPPAKGNAVMIASAKNRAEAEQLWIKGAALNLAALTITEDINYQSPPPWLS